MQLAEEHPTVPNRVQAIESCARVARWADDTSGKNPYDARLNVSTMLPVDVGHLSTRSSNGFQCTMDEIMNCWPEVQWGERIMNDTRLRDAVSHARQVSGPS
jgi:hypothetical protein